jgi:hypothetical protein
MKATAFASILAFVLLSMALPAAAQPVSIAACGTISSPGSYVLTQNLTASGTACLTVSASSVTLDLNGFRIQGTCCRAIITSSSSISNLTVRNGTIRNFATAVLSSGSDTAVDSLSVINCTGAGLNLGRARVTNTIVINSGSDGIKAGAGSVIVHNTVNGNHGNGIVTGANSTVTENRADSNQLAGISTGGSSALGGNSANSNLVSGLAVSCPSNVFFNTALNNPTDLSESGGPPACNNFQNLAP